MGALDTAKEIVRMTSATSLGKDVIDLLKEKVALLSEQITTLETENKNLKAKVYDLEQELKQVKPKGDLADDTVSVLKLLFQNDGLTVSQIAGALSMVRGMAEYHCGVLFERKMIVLSMMRSLVSEDPYYLSQKGREYLVKNSLV